jgi:hypothetical protein
MIWDSDWASMKHGVFVSFNICILIGSQHPNQYFPCILSVCFFSNVPILLYLYHFFPRFLFISMISPWNKQVLMYWYIWVPSRNSHVQSVVALHLARPSYCIMAFQLSWAFSYYVCNLHHVLPTCHPYIHFVSKVGGPLSAWVYVCEL